MTPHALVIGKFYPPHSGHHLLVRTAAACARQVSVVVMAARWESIGLAQRAAWMREEHAGDRNVTVCAIEDDIAVDYDSEDAWRAHVDLMRVALSRIDAPPVTAVFGSEPYVTELARRFGARPVILDPLRTLAPMSGTRVRADPAGAWASLAPSTRAGLARRVVVVGAESTGTTTLSLDLAERLRARGGAFADTRWVAEFGREFTVSKLAVARAAAQLEGRQLPELADLVWTTQEFEQIAREQNSREEVAAREGGPVLVCDTDALATAVWHERYLGVPASSVEALSVGTPRALYLLTRHEGVPFEQDGLRDGEHVRAWMSGRFEQVLKERGHPYRALLGDRQARLESGLRAIEEILRDWRIEDR